MLFAPPPPEQPLHELQALLTLRLTPNVGPRSIEHLRQHFGSAHQALAAPKEALRQSKAVSAKALSEIGQPKYAQAAQTEQERCQASGVALLGRGLSGYPAALEALSDPPAVLWVRGKLPQLDVVPLSLGVVGTRAASNHALALARQISGELAQLGVVIVSGLARGIDTAAHTGAVDAGGQSVAVLGSAVNVIYPRENSKLAERLCLVSEYPLGTGPQTHHFPARNRIIAALSAGVWVVEGELKSGSLITATHALECGRSVFAMPGRAGDPKASGPHQLIRDGAVLTEKKEDILNELGWQMSTAQANAPRAEPPQAKQPATQPALEGTQRQVWEALTQPLTLDDLCQLTQLELGEVQTALVLLQLSGHAEEKGGRWGRVP